jgi:FkbM family methyltransferase
MTSLGIDLTIDVGANRGQFGLEVRAAGYTGQILSIEPLAEPYRRLTQLAARDGRWVTVHSAVGMGTGSATINVAGNEGASSSILPMLDLHARSAPNARYVTVEHVRLETLDDLVQPHTGDSTGIFTKIDVQGFELQVLAGAKGTLSRSTMVQLEMSLLPLYETAPSYQEVLDFMARHGFALVGIEPGIASATGALLQADGLFANQTATRFLQANPL